MLCQNLIARKISDRFNKLLLFCTFAFQAMSPSKATEYVHPPSCAASKSYGMDNRKMTPQLIEVCPGLRFQLRGADETWQAIQTGQIEVIDCSSCSTALCCIFDVSYVLCPNCRSITPVCAKTEEDNPVSPCVDELDTLGLGVRADALF